MGDRIPARRDHRYRPHHPHPRPFVLCGSTHIDSCSWPPCAAAARKALPRKRRRETQFEKRLEKLRKGSVRGGCLRNNPSVPGLMRRPREGRQNTYDLSYSQSTHGEFVALVLVSSTAFRTGHLRPASLGPVRSTRQSRKPSNGTTPPLPGRHRHDLARMGSVRKCIIIYSTLPPPHFVYSRLRKCCPLIHPDRPSAVRCCPH